MNPSELRPTDKVEYCSLDTIICVMCCEDIFCGIFLRYSGEEFISVFSCGGFDTWSLFFCETSNIHLLDFESDISTFANIRDELSISIRLQPTEWVIEVSDDYFLCWVMPLDEIKHDHTIDSTTHREDERIFPSNICLIRIKKCLHTVSIWKIRWFQIYSYKEEEILSLLLYLAF